jgi:hypothetical protein
MRVAVLLLCVSAISGFGASAGRAQRGSDLNVWVAVFYNAHQRSTVYAIELQLVNPPCPAGAECFTSPSEIVRGQVATFTIMNRGWKPHSFTIFDRTTKMIKPGDQASFVVRLAKRGTFPFRVDRGKTKALQGVFVVN